MSKFEILCVTMNQNDFSKIKEMNIHSNVVFANQCDHTSYMEITFENHTAKMISTQTRGVGTNRNLSITYATADICLLADDDIVYVDNLEEIVTSEFESHSDADVMIFNTYTINAREPLPFNKKTKKCRIFSRLPYGAFSIAFRLKALQTCNIWFNTLFGGGCKYSAGEDSIFLNDIKKSGLKLYVSNQIIGTIDFKNSSWFSGYTEKYFYDKGAFCKAIHPKTSYIWLLYYMLRFRNHGELSMLEKMQYMKKGNDGYNELITFSQ